jgi:hypothetical protein
MTRGTTILEGFAPIARADARVLILGSMPGAASLAAGEYYAHPRNAFWSIIEAVWDIPRSLPYAERARSVQAGALPSGMWSRCRRPTSLDADIDRASVVVNDFAGFLGGTLHPADRLQWRRGRGVVPSPCLAFAAGNPAAASPPAVALHEPRARQPGP